MHKIIRGMGFAGLVLAASALAPTAYAGHGDMPKSAGPLLYQNSMNVFRRFHVDSAKVFQFYGDVLGLKKLQTFTVGHGQKVARYLIGTQQVKFTKRTPDRKYQPGGVKNATGLRLLTFFFPDEASLSQRFEQFGYPVPKFKSFPNSDREYALVKDPDGQMVELIVAPDAPADTYTRLEIGLTVSNLKASRAFYRTFAGLQELPPIHDPVFNTTVYPFRHGTTTINLRSFGSNLPKDTGSGGIQYVVTNVDPINKMAHERHVTIESPLSTLKGFDLRTIWVDDPDGITNYFAETPQSRKGRASGSTK